MAVLLPKNPWDKTASAASPSATRKNTAHKPLAISTKATAQTTRKTTASLLAFNSGAVTDINDPVLDTGDAIKYKGDAYLASRGDIVKGSSDIDVYFADKQLEGDFTFAAGQKRTTPGKENEDAKYPGKIKFFGEIDGNTFEGGGKVDNRITTTTTVKGQFYGEGAAEMGGIFQIDSFISYTDGSFGAIKQ